MIRDAGGGLIVTPTATRQIRKVCMPQYRRLNLPGDRDRNEMVDHHQDDQEHETDPEAPADQLLLDRQQRLDRSVEELLADIRLRHRGFPFAAQVAKGGLTPLKNSQEMISPTQITKPNRLSR
jgi:hypothetical protein